ncbi:sugar kinase and transcription regulator [Latilactobacillus sakei subsp. sakei DSM 20017 = JCM 1157]|nr:sugar kinase and transcription regulator [Latilactobacillus sakei subsp. sakei DSM 20017 = JCM 1157]
MRKLIKGGVRMTNFVGIDIGGTTIKVGLVNQEGQIVRKEAFETPQDQTTLIAKLVQIIQDFQQTTPIAGVGVSVPGVVQADGFLTTAGAVKCLTGVDLKGLLTEKLNLPVAVENDANAAAIAEQWLGAAKGVTNYLSLVLGTGVGGALVINNQIYRGAHARSGEFGWMLVEDDEIDVEMGSLNFRGATVIGLLRRYNQFSADQLTDARIIFERAAQHEVLAQNVLTSYYHSLAKGIINLMVAFDPEKVIIGGGISANETFMTQLNAEIQNVQSVHNSIKDLALPTVVAADLKNEAGIIGAVYQVMQKR